jgi:hypothetical protein
MDNVFDFDLDAIEQDSLLPPSIFYWDDLWIKLQVLPTTSLHFGACTRRSVWHRVKPSTVYERSSLGKRKRDARVMMESKDYKLLSNGLEVATIGGEALPDTHTMSVEFAPNKILELQLPLIRMVEGKPTVVVVRSIASRAACNTSIYGAFKTPPQPQIRDLLYVSVLLHHMGLYKAPYRDISQVLLIYSDQAIQRTMQYLIILGRDGPICNGLVYHEMGPELVMNNLQELAKAVDKNDGTADFVYEKPEIQLAAVSANYIGQKDVGWQPVCGWPCRVCGWAKQCLPENCKGNEIDS